MERVDKSSGSATREMYQKIKRKYPQNCITSLAVDLLILETGAVPLLKSGVHSRPRYGVYRDNREGGEVKSINHS